MSLEREWYSAPGWRSAALLPLSWLYGLAVRLWHLAFDVGLRTPVRIAGARVISVGNLVVGGAGKTPAVIAIARAGLAAGKRVAVLSRGYGRRSHAVLAFDAAALPPVADVGDEPRLIARSVPGATVWVGADRVDTARRAVAGGAEVLVLDDGYQHRRLFRDVDLLVDVGPGNGRLLPAGPLREPLAAMQRATHVWRRAEGDAPAGVVPVSACVRSVTNPSGAHGPASALAGRDVVLLLGLARPARVEATTRALGANVVATLAYADHHAFTAAELQRAQATAHARGALLVTTEKDAERLPPGAAWVLRLELDVPPEALRALLS